MFVKLIITKKSGKLYKDDQDRTDKKCSFTDRYLNADKKAMCYRETSEIWSYKAQEILIICLLWLRPQKAFKF